MLRIKPRPAVQSSGNEIDPPHAASPRKAARAKRIRNPENANMLKGYGRAFPAHYPRAPSTLRPMAAGSVVRSPAQHHDGYAHGSRATDKRHHTKPKRASPLSLSRRMADLLMAVAGGSVGGGLAQKVRFARTTNAGCWGVIQRRALLISTSVAPLLRAHASAAGALYLAT